MLQPPERALRGHATRHEQRIQWSRKRTYVVRSRGIDIADHIHTYRAQAQQCDVRGNIAELCPQTALHHFLYIAQGSPGDKHRSRFGQSQSPLPVHRAQESL